MAPRRDFRKHISGSASSSCEVFELNKNKNVTSFACDIHGVVWECALGLREG